MPLGQRERVVQGLDEGRRGQRGALRDRELRVAVEHGVPAARVRRAASRGVSAAPVVAHQAAGRERAQRVDRARDVARGEQRVGVVAEHEPDRVLPAGARPDPVRERAALGETRAANRLARRR